MLAMHEHHVGRVVGLRAVVLLFLLRLNPTNPTRPEPSRSAAVGMGTGLASCTTSS